MICLGAVNIVVDGNKVARFGAGKGFGELALVNETSTRAATIVAAKDRTLVGVLHGSTCVYAYSWKIIDVVVEAAAAAAAAVVMCAEGAAL